MPQEQKDFLNKVFTKEGDIFEKFRFDWQVMKELILKEIFKGVRALESYTALGLSDEVVSSVAQIVAGEEKVGV